MHICVCSLELADKCVPGHWPEESEAKLGHLVLQPGTDQSARLPLAVVFFPLSPPIWTYISTHALTDRPRLSVQSQWSRDGLCEAAMLEATGSTHCSTMTCWLYFSIQGRIWCHPSPLCVGKWNQALWALLKCKNTLWRIWIHKLISMQKRIPAVKGKMQRYFSVWCLLSCMKWHMLVWIRMAGFGCRS